MTEAAGRATAAAIIDALGMRSHPEGGWYVERWRAPDGPDGRRAPASAILFLLAAGEQSHWHRLDAAEVWQWSAGEALDLLVWSDGDPAITVTRLGGDVAAGEEPQAIVPGGAWQSARPIGAWTLVGCIVAPAFTFEGFELATPDWAPPVDR